MEKRPSLVRSKEVQLCTDIRVCSGAPAGVTAHNFSNKKLTRIKLETTLSHQQFIVQMQCIFSLKFLLIPPRWRT